MGTDLESVAFSRWPPFSGRLKSSDHRILKNEYAIEQQFLVNTSSSFLITEIPPEKNEGPYLSIFQLPV